MQDSYSSNRLSFNGGTIAYDIAGSGPLVVCLPGLGDLRGQYRMITPLLVQKGFCVVTADLRGHGESSTQWESYTPEEVGRDLLALIEHLNRGPALVISNSFSCASSVWAAAEKPSLVRGMVLIGPFVRQLPVSAFQKMLLSVLFTRPWGPSAWGSYYASLYPTRKPTDFVSYRTTLVQNLKEQGRFEATKAMVNASKSKCEARIPEVRAPTLVVMGEKDPDFKFPEQEAKLVAELLRGEVLMVKDAGHYPHAEFPEQMIDTLVRFLQTHGTA